MKFKYLRKYFFESNKKFEKRINTELELYTSEEVINIVAYSNFAILAYKERTNNTKPPIKVKGFSK